MKSAGERFRGVAFASATAALLIVTSFLHFWRIGSAPPGFYADESAHAYNAYCIARTGADEYGTPFPVIFRGFGGYECDAMMVYPKVPFVAAFGLKKWAARFPDALMSVLASVVFAFLVFEYCRNRWLSAVSGFCFSLIPWLFAMSRTATGGYTALILGLTSGWLLALLALRKRSYGFAILCGLAWAFTMYTYAVGRVVAVLLVISLGVSFFRELKTLWKLGLAFVVSWVVCLVPLIVAAARTPAVLTSRFQGVGVFQDNPSWSMAVCKVASRYLEYFSSQFLFLKGDPNLRQHTGFAGELFLFLFPMILAGLYCLIRRARSQPSYRFLGLGLLVYPVAAALTDEHLHSGRCINGVVFWAVTAAIGAHFLWQQRNIGRKLLVLACCGGVIEMALYLRDYFGEYQIRSRRSFSAPFTEALEDSFRALDKSDTLYISRRAVSPLVDCVVDKDFKPIIYADILFLGRIDPRVYQQSGIPRDRVRAYGGKVDNPGLLLCAGVTLTQGIQGRPVEVHDPTPVDAKLLETKLWDEGVEFQVYRVK